MWLDLLSISFAIIVSIPLVVIVIELLISICSYTEIDNKHEFEKVSFTILMPAHNEAEIISKTLERLFHQSVLPSSILLIADNCTDNTAEIARGLGVIVLERFNDAHRGKGYALDHGISYLKKQAKNNVLIILDSDCEITSESLNLLATQCQAKSRPIQALYLMRGGNESSLSRRIAGFAWLVKNKIRPMAAHKLGLPTTLTGTGMAFPWKVIAEINVAHGNIVEDMQLGIDCTLNGYSPMFCQQAIVYSEFPEQKEATTTQRTRWEHGHLMTILQQVPVLLKQAWLKKDWRLLGLSLDIGVPPLALLVLLSLISLLILAICSFTIGSYSAFFLLLSSFLLFTIMLIITWWKFGREYLSVKELLAIPVYIFSKIFIYVQFIFKRQKSWIRTSRDIKK